MTSLKDPIVRVHAHLHFAAAAAVSTQNLFPDLQNGLLPPQNVSIQMCGLFINKMCGLNALSALSAHPFSVVNLQKCPHLEPTHLYTKAPTQRPHIGVGALWAMCGHILGGYYNFTTPLLEGSGWSNAEGNIKNCFSLFGRV